MEMPRCALQATRQRQCLGINTQFLSSVNFVFEKLGVSRELHIPESFTSAACKRAGLAPAMEQHQLGHLVL